jgi:acetyl esterase/lipase
MGYAFDPELAALLELMPPFTIEDVPAAREAFTAVMAGRPAELPRPEILRIVDRTVPGPPGAPDVRVRVYAPAGPVPGHCWSLPAVLYLHSGGWVFGSLPKIRTRQPSRTGTPRWNGSPPPGRNWASTPDASP